MASELGLHVADPLPEESATSGFYSRVAFDLGHHNEEGNRVVANKVLAVLKEILGPGIGPADPPVKPTPN